MEAQIILGISLALLSTCFFSIPALLQKRVVRDMDEIKTKNFWKSMKKYFKNKMVILSYVLLFVGGILYFVSYSLAGMVIVAPLMNVGFIILVYGAHRYLGEKLDLISKLAVGLLIVLPVFIALGKVSEPVAISNWMGFASFFAIVMIILFGFVLLTKKIAFFWAMVVGLVLALTNVALQEFSINFAQGSLLDLVSLIPIILVAGFGILSFLLTPIALQKMDASIYGPVQQTTNNLATIVGGILIYQQVVGNWGFYSVGVFIGIIGVIILGKYQRQMK